MSDAETTNLIGSMISVSESTEHEWMANIMEDAIQKLSELQSQNAELVEALRQIKLTEDDYNGHDFVLSEIYLITEKALAKHKGE